MDNADIIFRKLHDNQIDDIPIEDGNVMFNKDTKQILVDDDDNGVEKRYRFGGSEKLINVTLLTGSNTKTIYDDAFSTNNLSLIRIYSNENFTYSDIDVYDGYCIITYKTLDHDVNIQVGIGGVSEFYRLIVEGQASDISYNHSISGLQATNTQEAIDELETDQDTLSTEINKLETQNTLSLGAGSWSSSAPYTQTVNLARITSSDTPIISMGTPSTISSANYKAMKKAYGYIDRVVSNNGSLTFYCYNKKPTVQIRVLVKGV